MKRYWFIFVLVLVVFTITHVAWADNFEWYTLKDEVSGGINFRSSPSLDGEILECMIIGFIHMVPLFKIVEKRPDGWYKAQSNRNGVARNVDYEYGYFWVAGWYLRKVDIEKEKLGILVPADYEYYEGIRVHKEPHVFSDSEHTVPSKLRYIYASVKMTGKHIGPLIEIIQLRYSGKGSKDFVLSGYFGFKVGSEYLEFSIPKILYTRAIRIDGGHYSGSFNVRSGPSILNEWAGNYGSGGMKVTVIGEQGHFYKTSKGNKWILKQCLVDSVDSKE